MQQMRHLGTSIVVAALAAIVPGIGSSSLDGGSQDLPNVLPPDATTSLARSLAVAAPQANHPWAHVPPFGPDGLVNAYIEIARGDRRKWEFDMRAARRTVDRWIPADVGGYPVNYGFVPQTIFVDGDPFDALVLGPPLRAGALARGRIVGVMFMTDAGLVDSKVVLSPVGADGRPLFTLGAAEQSGIGAYFRRYKQDEDGAKTEVPGWGSEDEGLAHVRQAHAFFMHCRDRSGQACDLKRR